MDLLRSLKIPCNHAVLPVLVLFSIIKNKNFYFKAYPFLGINVDSDPRFPYNQWVPARPCFCPRFLSYNVLFC